ncbi:MAG: alpha/beta fold hydrolase [Gemmatimonadota bacterium]
MSATRRIVTPRWTGRLQFLKLQDMKIPVSHGHLEGHLRPGSPPLRGAAVLCHPHPQHGGTMHTKAVFRSAQALCAAGFEVLRFNFRGVGTSTGLYGGGTGEEEDVEAALDWLEDRHPDLPLLVGGFSFGSRVGLTVGAREERVKGLLGLGLPLRNLGFPDLAGLDNPLLVVQGENDEFGSGSEVEDWVRATGGPITLVRIPQSDHYFHDHFEELQSIVEEYFTVGPGAEAFPRPQASRTGSS